MTKEEIGELVAALPQGLDADEFIFKLVNWAVDREREACEEAIEEVARKYRRQHYADAENIADECAGAIRARGEK